MKLRDQCEHGRWDAHPIDDGKGDRHDRHYCPGGREIVIDYEAAIGAFEDTPFVTCGECLGDGRIVVPPSASIVGGVMPCSDCNGIGSVPTNQAIRNAVEAALGIGANNE